MVCKEISEKAVQIGRARCPILWIQIRTYEKSITYLKTQNSCIPVGRVHPEGIHPEGIHPEGLPAL